MYLRQSQPTIMYLACSRCAGAHLSNIVVVWTALHVRSQMQRMQLHCFPKVITSNRTESPVSICLGPFNDMHWGPPFAMCNHSAFLQSEPLASYHSKTRKTTSLESRPVPRTWTTSTVVTHIIQTRVPSTAPSAAFEVLVCWVDVMPGSGAAAVIPVHISDQTYSIKFHRSSSTLAMSCVYGVSRGTSQRTYPRNESRIAPLPRREHATKFSGLRQLVLCCVNDHETMPPM